MGDLCSLWVKFTQNFRGHRKHPTLQTCSCAAEKGCRANTQNDCATPRFMQCSWVSFQFQIGQCKGEFGDELCLYRGSTIKQIQGLQCLCREYAIPSQRWDSSWGRAVPMGWRIDIFSSTQPPSSPVLSLFKQSLYWWWMNLTQWEEYQLQYFWNFDVLSLLLLKYRWSWINTLHPNTLIFESVHPLHLNITFWNVFSLYNMLNQKLGFGYPLTFGVFEIWNWIRILWHESLSNFKAMCTYMLLPPSH